jgi:hypothetical protein
MEPLISYDLRLKESVGPINLGVTRQEVRSILGEPWRSSEDSLHNTDHYTPIRLPIDYEPDTEICRGIEVLNGAELTFRNNNIFDLSWENMYQWMLENDPDLDIRGDRYTFISHRLGIAAGTSHSDSLGEEAIETIVVFSDGYWPSKEEMKARVRKEIEEMPSLEEMSKELGLEWFFEPEST